MNTLRRRIMMQSAYSTPYPLIILGYGGTPWTTMVSIAEPNKLYVANQNWNAAFYSLRDRSRTDPASTFNTEWFKIPANATCQLVLRNVQRKPDTSNALDIIFSVIDDTGNAIGSIRTYAIGAGVKEPKTFTGNFTTTEEKSIHNMYVRGYSTSKNFYCECELWVNGVQWL